MSRHVLYRHIIPIVQKLFPDIEINDRLLTYLDREITFNFGVIGGLYHCPDLEAKVVKALRTSPARFRHFLKKLVDEYLENNERDTFHKYDTEWNEIEEFPDRLKDLREQAEEVLVN
ncbi:MAG: hypothetical protein NWE83_04595 [Candidatus Bathyarchaeota archaeon]|nr:hypothetical protein [Candidatus Bathyarchaeota archaeon]